MPCFARRRSSQLCRGYTPTAAHVYVRLFAESYHNNPLISTSDRSASKSKSSASSVSLAPYGSALVGTHKQVLHACGRTLARAWGGGCLVTVSTVEERAPTLRRLAVFCLLLLCSAFSKKCVMLSQSGYIGVIMRSTTTSCSVYTRGCVFLDGAFS